MMDEATAGEETSEVEVAVQDMRAIRVGAARVTMLNAGNMRTKLSQELAVPEAVWRPQYADLFEQLSVFPSLSVFVEYGGIRLLVDANDYRATMTAESEYAIAGYAPPPPIASQLASLGVQPEGDNQKPISDLIVAFSGVLSR
jgi:hypothetical protein